MTEMRVSTVKLTNICFFLQKRNVHVVPMGSVMEKSVLVLQDLLIKTECVKASYTPAGSMGLFAIMRVVSDGCSS